MNLKEVVIVTFIITVLGGITLNVMACDETISADCTVEDDLTGC